MKKEKDDRKISVRLNNEAYKKVTDAVLRGIAENAFFFYRPVKGIVQHHVNAAHSGIAQAGFFLFLYFSQPPIALQIVVELLQVAGSELIQRDIPDSRDDMLFDVPVVVVHGGWADMRFGIQFKPCPQPCGNRIFICAADVQCSAFLNGFL